MTDNGAVDKIAGKTKEVAGDLTGDEKMKSEGLMDQVIGKAKEVAEGAKDVAETIAHKAGEAVEGVTNSVKNHDSEQN